MGLFDKLKNILFEEDEDDTMTDIPDYKKNIKEEKVSEVKPVINEDKGNQIDNSKFKNVKRDIDLSFSDEEVTPKNSNEVQHTRDIMAELKRDVQTQREERRIEEVRLPEEKPLPQRRSVFQSFDAEEFDRQNQRSNELELKRREEFRKREEAIKKEKEERLSMNQARMANSNFSSTTTGKKETDPDRYKISNDNQGKKPFRPSPVISPVYGILDKNYTADEIVDKTDGMKREKINPVVRTPEISSEIKKDTEIKTIEEAFNDYDEEKKEISIESVRDKAFGVEKSVPKEFDIIDDEEDTIVDDIEEVIDEINEEDALLEQEEIVDVPKVKEATIEEETFNKNEEIESEEDLSARFVKDDSFVKEENKTLLDDEPKYVPEEEFDEEDEAYEGDSLLDVEDDKVNKSHILDDMEKTSTLQILDDIEKELNSIKSDVVQEKENVYTDEERLERNDTLENDLFNLIDSMYANGEEDEEND